MAKDQVQYCKEEVVLNGVTSLTKPPYNLNFKQCEPTYPPFHACIFAQGFKVNILNLINCINLIKLFMVVEL